MSEDWREPESVRKSKACDKLFARLIEMGATDEELASVTCVGETPRRHKKRAPSPYNKYIKQCFLAKGGVKSFGEAAPLMKECAREYREDKKRGEFRYKIDEV